MPNQFFFHSFSHGGSGHKFLGFRESGLFPLQFSKNVCNASLIAKKFVFSLSRFSKKFETFLSHLLRENLQNYVGNLLWKYVRVRLQLYFVTYYNTFRMSKSYPSNNILSYQQSKSRVALSERSWFIRFYSENNSVLLKNSS